MSNTKSVNSYLVTPANQKGLKKAIKLMISLDKMIDGELEIPQNFLEKPIVVFIELEELIEKSKTKEMNQDNNLS